MPPPEQLRLVAQDCQVRKAVPTVGQHHHKIAQHLSGLMPMPAGLPTAGPPGERLGQPESVGQLDQYQRAGVADNAVAIGGDVNTRAWLGTLHRQGALLEWDCSRQTAAFSLLRRAPACSADARPNPPMNSPG
jgi:hypothetical protein